MSVDLSCKAPMLQYTEYDVRKILSIYGRNVSDLDVDVELIKNWLKTQPHITELPSERVIVSFLLMNKFSIEKTKSRLEMSYSIRNLMPQYFVYTPLHPKIVESHRFMKLFPISTLTKDFRRIIVLKYEKSESYDMTTFIVRIIFGLELLAMYDFSLGDEYILDHTNITFSMISKTSPMDIKRLVTLLDKVYGNKFNAMHIINMPQGSDAIVTIFKSFMKPKLRHKMIFHKSVDNLKNYLPRELLPKDYGGHGISVDESAEQVITFIESHEQHFLKWTKISVDDKLRPEPLANDDILGYHGNFRKLNVD